MATWPCHVISLVIMPNDILLSSLITLAYCLVPSGSPFWYIKPHLSIIWNWLSYIALLKSPPAAIPFVGKRTSCYSSIILLQFRFLLTNIPFVGTRLFFSRIRWDSDHPTKSCNWWMPTEQNQPRIALALGRRDSSSKRRCQALGNLRDEAQDIRHAGRNKAWLPGVCLTLLQEKLVAPMLL